MKLTMLRNLWPRLTMLKSIWPRITFGSRLAIQRNRYILTETGENLFTEAGEVIYTEQ